MLVVDASALVPALTDDASAGDTVRALMSGQELHAPELIDLEVAAVLRRLHATGRVDSDRVAFAFQELGQLPCTRAPHLPLLPRIWSLRENISAYDAAYVALAEALDAELLTADARLARAPGIRCSVSVVS